MSVSARPFSCVIMLLLTACGIVSEQDGPPRNPPDVGQIPDAVPKYEPRSKSGNPRKYTVFGKTYYTLTSAEGYHEKGIASWYGNKFHGRKTANGEVYNMYAMSAAHKTLPLPTYVEVINLRNGRRVVVRVNDRGPFHGNRLIDLSYSAAKKLGIIGTGTGLVEVQAITPETYVKSRSRNTVKRRPETVPDTTKLHQAELFLHVGAFRTQNRAELVKARLKLADIGTENVSIVPLEQPDGRLYRVRIGPLASVAAGDSLARRLAGLGFVDAYIVVE